MTPHQLKEGYLSLPPRARREFVLWAVQKEFSDHRQTDELEPDQSKSVRAALAHGQSSGAVSTAFSPGKSFFLKGAGVFLIVLLVAGVAGLYYHKYHVSERHDLKAEADHTAEAVVRSRPGSPTDLDFLDRHLGEEVTLRGVPVKAEVGYLYFAEHPAQGVLVKLISGGMVVYQSTDLEKWVKDQQELEIRGTLIRNKTDDAFEIPIERQVQVKLLEK